MNECRIKKELYPKEGEVVMCRTKAYSGHEVQVELVEYGNVPGLILYSELSKKSFKSAAQVTKIGVIQPCLVLKVDESKGFIDLSLKRITEEEKEACKDLFNKNKLTYQIMLKVAKNLNLNVADLYEDFGYAKEAEYGSLYNYFSRLKEDIDVLEDNKYSEALQAVIKERFVASSFKIRADVEVSCSRGGIEYIKKAFHKALEIDNTLEICLLKVPFYSIVKIAKNKAEGFEIVEKACAAVKSELELLGGEFNIAEPAKIYGEKSRYAALKYEDTKSEDSSESEN